MSYPHIELLERYKAAIERVDGLELKGKSMPYTSVNGHMTSFLDKDGRMGLRLSKEELTVFLAENDTQLMEQHGRIMKDFAVVSGSVLNDSKALVKCLKSSFRSASVLKPKATKK